MERVTRLHLKSDTKDRKKLIKFCLHGKKQYVAIGWIGAYKFNPDIKTYEDYYYACKSYYSQEGKKKWRYNPCHNVFWDTKEGDLFWTRDLEGAYWICRALGKAQPLLIEDLDVGAVVPVKAYKFGLEVPGQIKASFTRPRSYAAETISDKIIIEFSKKTFNDLSGTKTYEIEKVSNDILDNLPDFDLEELVISYIQITKNYYLLSNSIANKSTTIKIECEFIGRDKNNFRRAVVQVKGGKTREIDALDYKSYDDAGYFVFLYAPRVINQEKLNNCIVITREQLHAFYKEYKSILPDSITKWENIL